MTLIFEHKSAVTIKLWEPSITNFHMVNDKVLAD